MKKRNIFTKAIAVCSIASVLFLGCGSSSPVSVDTEALATSLTGDISYDNELTVLSEDEITNYVTVEKDVKCIMYMSSGSTAEEVAVFTAPDEETASTMKNNVQEFLNDQKTSFEDYIPEEAKRIEDAVLVVNGNYVVLCVSGDSAKAKEIIDSAFK